MGYEGGCGDQKMFLVFIGAREGHKATKATLSGFSGDFFSLTQNELNYGVLATSVICIRKV